MITLFHHWHQECGDIDFTITPYGMHDSGRGDKHLPHGEFHFAIPQHSESFAFQAIKNLISANLPLGGSSDRICHRCRVESPQ
jgi:hypothetical protein